MLADGNLEVNGVVSTKLTVGPQTLGGTCGCGLKSKVDFGDASSSEFEGITFSNIPIECLGIWFALSDCLPSSWAYADPVLPYEWNGHNQECGT